MNPSATAMFSSAVSLRNSAPVRLAGGCAGAGFGRGTLAAGSGPAALGLASTIAQVKATQVIGWVDFGWDVAGFGVYTVLAILLGRRMGLATTTPGVKKPDGVDPWAT